MIDKTSNVYKLAEQIFIQHADKLNIRQCFELAASFQVFSEHLDSEEEILNKLRLEAEKAITQAKAQAKAGVKNDAKRKTKT